MGITFDEVQQAAEELKEKLWYLMECQGTNHQGIRDSMNELLDLIDELDPKVEK